MTSSTATPTRRLRPARLAAVVLVAAGALLAACGTPAPSQADLTTALIDSGVSKAVASCTSKALVTSLSSSELQELTERGGGGAPVDDPKRTDDSADKLNKAMVTCRELQAATTSTTAPTGGEGQGQNETTTTTGVAITSDAELNPASTTTTAG